MPQVWNIDSAGGFMYSDQLSDVLRNALQPMMRFQQHCDADDFSNKGLHKGDKFYWNRYSNVKTKGGRLQEKQRMPSTSFTVSQASGTIYQYGNSIDYDKLLDDLSLHPIRQIIHKTLKNDAKDVFESEAYDQFAACKLVVSPASGTSTTAVLLETAGTCSNTNNVAMNSTHVKLVADIMKERNIPVYMDGNYRCIGRPSTFRTFKDELESKSQYVPQGFGQILNGEVGRSYEGIRFFEQTAIASRGWSNGKSDEAFFFGEDTVMEAVVIPPEIRGKIPGDYGLDMGVAWYALEGFALVHDTAADGRIIKWDSAA